MKCSKCYYENPDDANFCIECANPMEFRCPQCAAITPGTGKFCKECGHDLKQPTTTPDIDFDQPQSYTPKFLADKIITTRSSIEGERKLVTVLFADVANYTGMAEKLDPEEVHQIMDGCFKILMDEIHRYEGTINQFTGDGVMALFGAPLAHEDHASRACHAALSIHKALKNYEKSLQIEYGLKFKMRIGLNSGPVVVGSIGDDLRMDYTAIGDTTNLASRIEHIAGPGTSMVSRNTHRLARDFMEFKALGKIEVKGKDELQEVFELVKVGKVDTRIAASAAKGLTRFVGRKNSMATLMEAYDKAQSGSGQVIGVVGDAGVGKSRLFLEFKCQLPGGETTFLGGQCLHFGSAMSYLPVLDILRSYFEIKEGDQESLIKKNIEDKIIGLDEKLHSVLPPFYELLSLTIEDDAYQKLDRAQKREKIFEATRDLLVRESQDRPVIITVEDLHWIDKTSEEFLSYLIEWLANSRILLVLLYRPEYTDTWGSKSYYNRIGLDQLTTKSSTKLIQSILKAGEPMPELRELILNRAAGNPLYMEEFTHTLLENNAIQCQGQKCVLIKNASEIQVPDTIQGIIAARMDRLEDDLKKTMQVASVIGKDFAYRILDTITEMSEELKSCLLNLQGLEFIYEKNLFPELEYVFKHALTQEVAYNSLLQKRRKEIHAKIGHAIEELWPDRLEEFYETLAYHYSRGENHEKAYQYLKLSGNKAAKNYANWESFRFFNEALNILTRMPVNENNKRAQIEVSLLAIGPMSYLGYPENSLDILKTGETLSKELEDEKGLAHFLSQIGQYYAFKGGDLLQAIQYSENSFKEAEKINDVELMAPIGADLVLLYFWRGAYAKVTDLASNVVASLEDSQRQADYFGRPHNVYALLLTEQATCSWRMGYFEEGESLFKKAFDFALKKNDLFSLGLLELNRGWEFALKGDAKTAIAHLQDSIRYCEEGQIVNILTAIGIGLGWAHWLAGDLEKARTHMDKALKTQMDVGVNFDSGLFYSFAALVDLDCGDQKKAQQRAEEALKIAEKNHQHGEGFVWIALGRILGKADSPQKDRAEEALLRGINILEELKIVAYYAPGYYFLGEFYDDTDQKDKALKTLNKAQRLYQEMGMDFWLLKTKKLLRLMEG